MCSIKRVLNRLRPYRCKISMISFTTISIAAVFCFQNLICLLFIFADQVFIDPTLFGIFVCGPLQSFVVNICSFTTFRCEWPISSNQWKSLSKFSILICGSWSKRSKIFYKLQFHVLRQENFDENLTWPTVKLYQFSSSHIMANIKHSWVIIVFVSVVPPAFEFSKGHHCRRLRCQSSWWQRYLERKEITIY